MRAFDYFLLAFFLFFVIICTYFLVQLKQEGTKCIASPLQYGIGSLEDKTKTTISCTCSFSDPHYSAMIVTRNHSAPLDTGYNPDSEWSNFTFNYTLR